MAKDYIRKECKEVLVHFNDGDIIVQFEIQKKNTDVILRFFN